MFSFRMRPEGRSPSTFKKLIGLQRGIVGAPAISFAVIPFSRHHHVLAPAFGRSPLLCLVSME
jgi:hypothetical protein